jgi:hypothetical protein
MSKFGWSYPPGCSGPPDEDSPCAVCCKSDDACVCPECPTCGSVGDPRCYAINGHDLKLSREQVIGRAEAAVAMAQERVSDAGMYLDFLKDGGGFDEAIEANPDPWR